MSVSSWIWTLSLETRKVFWCATNILHDKITMSSVNVEYSGQILSHQPLLNKDKANQKCPSKMWSSSHDKDSKLAELIFNKRWRPRRLYPTTAHRLVTKRISKLAWAKPYKPEVKAKQRRPIAVATHHHNDMPSSTGTIVKKNEISDKYLPLHVVGKSG